VRLARSRYLSWLVPFLFLLPAAGQAPGQKPSPKPAPAQASATNSTQIPEQAPIPSPVSRHFPILIVAHGNEPSWSLRLGMKGPERLDRAGYPPIVLQPADFTSGESDTSWVYSAKDLDTEANVSVKLTRDACSDGMSDTKYTFRAEVDHAQIGQLKGCGQSEPDKFPEFRKKNQIDNSDNIDTKPKDEKEKENDYRKSVLDPITGFHSPVATAYLDSAGRIIVAHGETHKTAAPAGSGVQPALSHDGKFLLYTRSDSKTGPERSIVLWQFDTGSSRVLAGDNVQQPFWSPDDSRFAFLKYDGKVWQIWTAPIAAPQSAALLSSQNITALEGWVNPTTVLATDLQNAYWISEDKPAQTVPLKDIYGDAFQIMSSDTIRVSPINPDLLLVSAYYLNAPSGAPTDQVGLNQTFFLYEVRSHRRTILGPPDLFARNPEWSRDGLQIFFTRGVPGKTALTTDRMFWDGSGLKHYSIGNSLVVGR
jgi:uncharacterized membrane protein